MWPLKTITYFIFFWILCLAALVNPIWGVVNYIFAYQLHPPVRWWGQPLEAIGLRFSFVAIVFALFGLFSGRRNVPENRPGFTFWEVGMLSLVMLGAMNILFGVGFDSNAQYAFEKFWKLQVFVLVLTRLATTRRNLRLVIWSIVFGCLYLGWDAFTAPRWRFALGRLEAFGGPDIATSSGASAHLAAMLPIVGLAFLIAKNWRWKLLAAVSGALTVNAIVLCRTRGAFLGLAAGLIAALLMAPRTQRFRVHLLLGLGAIAAFSLTDPNYWARMNTMTSMEGLQADPAAQGRFDIWEASISMLADYPLGVGLGNFTAMIGTYDPALWKRSSHNTLVMSFCELGVLGGVVFLAMIWGSIRYARQCRHLADGCDEPLETKMIAYCFVVSIVTYFVAGLATERFSCESFWWVLAFPLCLFRVVCSERHEHALAAAAAQQHRAMDEGYSVGPMHPIPI